MPTAPTRVCPAGHVVPGAGRCPTCKRADTDRRGHAVDLKRSNSNARGYDYRWHQRAKAFRAKYPLCGMRPGNQRPVLSYCFEAGRATPGAQVDHVVPHGGNMDLFWDEIGNWQTLCQACGIRKTRAGL